MIKKNLKVLIITSIIILLPILAGVFLWDQLPEQIPAHWNASGEVDGWSSKPFTVFGMPLILLAFQWLCVLGEGRLVNLACGDGHPAEIMDMSFAIQALSAKYLVEHGSELSEKLIDVPRSVDEDVAARKLAFLGKKIDVLTAEQEAYLNKALV